MVAARTAPLECTLIDATAQLAPTLPLKTLRSGYPTKPSFVTAAGSMYSSHYRAMSLNPTLFGADNSAAVDPKLVSLPKKPLTESRRVVCDPRHTAGVRAGSRHAKDASAPRLTHGRAVISSAAALMSFANATTR